MSTVPRSAMWRTRSGTTEHCAPQCGRLGLLALASAGAAAFAPTVPGGRLALRRSHVASQRPTGARHRVVCQANAAPVTVEVDATEVEPFLAFPGVSDKVRRTQRVRV